MGEKIYEPFIFVYFQRNLTELGPSAGWNRDVMDKRLLMWYYESQLKSKYADFLSAVQVSLFSVVMIYV